MLITTAISLAMPLISRNALDRVLHSGNLQQLDALAARIGGLMIASAVLGYIDFLLMARVGNRIVRDMRVRLFAHLQRLPVSYFDRVRSGDLATRLSNDVTLLQQSLTDDLIRLAGNLITLVGGIAMAVVIDARLTALVVLLLAAVFGVFIVLGTRMRGLSRDALEALSSAMGSMTESLSNVRLVKAFVREEHQRQHAETLLHKVYTTAMRSARFEAGLGSFGGIAFLGVLMGILWYGGRSVLAGTMTGGSLLAFFMTILLISGPMAGLAQLVSRLQRAMGAADRIFAILDEAAEPEEEPDTHPFPPQAGPIAFRDVHFAYNGGPPVLSGFNLTVHRGAVTALVGASGSGKTTVTSLLYRFYTPQSGEISIAGVPIQRIGLKHLREEIGLVAQEPTLFSTTIRENIRFGRLSASEAELEHAAAAANVLEFTERLPKGLDTEVGERGVTLSGGQKQRVAIARALLRNPKILVLDEATSALDTHSERLVQQALERLMAGRTTLVIAHRLTTIRNADNIAVLEGGAVVEEGTYEELVQRNGRFAALNRTAHTAPTADTL
jgi:subfamily B ATP-binding cassette protein MsbA